MDIDRRDSICDSLRRLVALLCEELALDPNECLSRPAGHDPPADHPDPVIDRTRFTVTFRGHTCRLGNTIPFRFLARLAATPDRLIPHQDLIDDVWDGVCSDDALRSVVKHLRRRLRAGGLPELASAVRADEPGHYVLRLGR
jgi:DNA-binding response OmpR family regulator